MRVLHVLSEFYPLIKTGGLADAGAALVRTLRLSRVDARPCLPGYPRVMTALHEARAVWDDANFFGAGPVRLWSGTLQPLDLPCFVLDAPELFGRDGNPYMDDAGRDYDDNHRRFAALCCAAAMIADGVDASFVPDVVQCHDWQAGLTAAYVKLRMQRRVPTIQTIHNLNYVGGFDAGRWPTLGLPDHAFNIHGAEFYGRISFLKAGLYYADRLTTVSPSYAGEIQSAGHGAGFEGLLHERRDALTGILNGVDPEEWNPARDPHLAAPYDGRTLNRKRTNRDALLEELGLPIGESCPTFGVVSRLAWQKGLDLLPGAAESLLSQGRLRLLVLGNGDRELESHFAWLARRFPEQVGLRIGYDEGLAHRMQAGCDALIVPSRSEPCGLTQLYALRYGTVPVVRATGGLADTVVDVTPEGIANKESTGFRFAEASEDALRHALSRACDAYADPSSWRALQHNGMRQDFGWKRAARSYVALYQELAPHARLSSRPPRGASGRPPPDPDSQVG